MNQLVYISISAVILFAIMAVLVVLLVKNYRASKKAEGAALEASRAKSAFLAHMSHEIRTPMNTIAGMTELVLRETISDEARKYAMFIKQASVNMLSIINDILDLSKIEAGRMDITCKEYSTASLIEEVAGIARARLSEKSLLFAVNIDGDIPKYLVGDDARIKQILLNLIGNAIKYTKEGHITVTVKCETDMEEKTASLTVDVADTGVGIKKEAIGKLFTSFMRADALKNRNIEGTGLGLAISRNLARAMDGDVTVRSEYGAGSTFTVTFRQKFERYEKLAEVRDPEGKTVLLYEPRIIYAESIMRAFEGLGVSCSLASSRPDFYDALIDKQYSFIFMPYLLFDTESQRLEELGLISKIILMTDVREIFAVKNMRIIPTPLHCLSIANILNEVTGGSVVARGNKNDVSFTAPSAKILVVDDVSTNLAVAEGLMSPYKIQIDICKTGRDAVDLVKSNRYDLIFMDHIMSDMDGIETTGVIRSLKDKDETGYYENVPIIALTANAVSGMREIFLKNGMNDYLYKPIELSKLNNILSKWIPKEKRENYPGYFDIPEPSGKKEGEGTEMSVSGAIGAAGIEGVDIKTGLALNGGIMGNYIKTLEVFYSDGPEKISLLNDCLKRGDIKLYTTLVHGLKSAALSIGAGKLSDFAKSLEMAGKSGSFDFIAEHNGEFLAEFEKLLLNINAAVAGGGERDKAELEAGDAEFLKTALAELKTALENMEAGKINNLIKELENRTFDRKNNAAISKLSRLILVSDYDEAVTLIEGMII